MHAVDLLIIGTGPAGISTALHLLQQDPSWAGHMLLLEKTAHPRPKPCGGGVTRLGLEILKNLAIDLPVPIPQVPVDDVRLRYRSRTIHVRGQPRFVVFNRAEFDAYLADQARQRGAKIMENTRLEDLAVDSTSVIAWTSQGVYRAKALVGADGANGVVRRLVKDRRTPTRVARLLEVVSPALETAPHFTQCFALFDFSLVQDNLQGYFWDFPSRVGSQPHFNRGVYDARFAPYRPRANLPKLLHQSLETLGADPESVKVDGYPIHWFSPRNRFSAPRILLVGDAAGADPLFGEGIAPALGYGVIAAEAIQQAFASGDFSFQDYRERLLRSSVGLYLLLRWCVAWWTYRLSGKAWFMHGLWTLGAAFAALWPQPESLYHPVSSEQLLASRKQ